MTTNATVAGGSNTTLTVAFTTAAGAFFGQQALNTISTLVNGGSLTFINYTGQALPPIASPTAFDALYVGSAQAPFSMPNGYLAAVINAPAVFNDAFGANETIVSGQSGIVMNNVNTNATIVLGGGASAINEAAPGATATVTLDGVAQFTDSSGSGHGNTVVNMMSGSLAVLGSSNNLSDGRAIGVAQGPATLINSAPPGSPTDIAVVGAGSLAYLPNGGTATIHLNGNTTIFGAAGAFGTSGAGAEIVMPGALSTYGAEGRLTVFSGNGWFQGGNAGANSISSSTIPGAATLVGGNSGDVLVANAGGDLLAAGAGAETLAGFGTDGDTFIGAQFSTGFVNNTTANPGGGTATVNATSMFGAPGGHNSMYGGGGVTAMLGNHSVASIFAAQTISGPDTVNGAATVTANGTILPGSQQTIANAVAAGNAGFVVSSGNGFFASGTGNTFGVAYNGGTDLIADFVPGIDHFLLNNPAGGAELSINSILYYAPNAPGSNFGATGGTDVHLSDGTHLEFVNAALSTHDFA